MDNLQQHIDMSWSMIIQYAPKVLLALLTLFIGLKIITLIDKIFEKNKVTIPFPQMDVRLFKEQ